ncbi:hypothetical protein ACLOJK_014475 [Asimina triloba]
MEYEIRVGGNGKDLFLGDGHQLQGAHTKITKMGRSFVFFFLASPTRKEVFWLSCSSIALSNGAGRAAEWLHLQEFWSNPRPSALPNIIPFRTNISFHLFKASSIRPAPAAVVSSCLQRVFVGIGEIGLEGKPIGKAE